LDRYLGLELGELYEEGQESSWSIFEDPLDLNSHGFTISQLALCVVPSASLGVAFV
jgi:hypothetical protein